VSNAPAACFAALLITAIVAPGCGSSREPATTAAIPSSLLSQARPIGAGRRFQPRATGPVIGRCSTQLGPRTGVHVEVFASNRVVLIPATIGTRPPRRISADPGASRSRSAGLGRSPPPPAAWSRCSSTGGAGGRRRQTCRWRDTPRSSSKSGPVSRRTPPTRSRPAHDREGGARCPRPSSLQRQRVTTD
jgi:hypothetical protein